jgi:hypothetical protein
MSEPVRVYFVEDDPAALWQQGDTADDLGPEYPGAPHHLFKLDHYDDKVAIEDPYGRGIVKRLLNEGESFAEAIGEEPPPGFSDEELDAWLDQQESDE